MIDPDIRYVRLPKVTLGGWGMTILGIILLFSFCPSMIALNCALDSPALRRAPEPVRTIVTGLMLIIPPAVGVVWFSTLHRSWIRNHGDVVARKRRIGPLLGRPVSGERYWHRAAELTLIGEIPSGKLYKNAMSKIPVGAALCLNWWDGTYLQRPCGNSLAFEPIEFVDESELKELIRADFEKSGRFRGQSARLSRPRRSTMILRLIQSLGTSLFMLVVLRQFYLLIMGGAFFATWEWFLIIFATTAPYWITQFNQKQCWIVPGGVIYRYAPFYRKAVCIEYFTRSDSALIVDFRGNLIALARGGSSVSVGCSEHAAMGVLVAWLSTARSPTNAEVLSCLGVPTR